MIFNSEIHCLHSLEELVSNEIPPLYAKLHRIVFYLPIQTKTDVKLSHNTQNNCYFKVESLSPFSSVCI